VHIVTTFQCTSYIESIIGLSQYNFIRYRTFSSCENIFVYHRCPDFYSFSVTFFDTFSDFRILLSKKKNYRKLQNFLNFCCSIFVHIFHEIEFGFFYVIPKMENALKSSPFIFIITFHVRYTKTTFCQ